MSTLYNVSMGAAICEAPSLDEVTRPMDMLERETLHKEELSILRSDSKRDEHGRQHELPIEFSPSPVY